MTDERTITGFKIIAKLGEGGMGAVYLARQLSLDRFVALKTLPPHLTEDPANVERVRQEARAAANLNHPNIVKVFEAGEADGIFFFAMEYIEGRSVSEWIEDIGRIPEDEAIQVAREVAEAMDYAWKEARLIHRDIKPENILMDKTGVAKVADLGLFRVAGKSASGAEAEDEGFCTPNYASPEQAMFKTDLDCRADIYSLGATLYQMITGTLPFDDLEPQDVADRQVNGTLEDPRKLNPEIRGVTAMLIRKMMAKSPGDRQADWSEVLEDVRHVQKGKRPAKTLDPSVASTIEYHTVSGHRTTKPGVRVKKRKRSAGRAPAPVAAPSRSRSATLIVLAILALLAVLGLAVGIPVYRSQQRREARRRVLARAETAYRKAQHYARENPSDFDGALGLYRQAVAYTRGTVYHQTAQDAISDLEEQKKRAVHRTFSEVKQQACHLMASRKYDEALAVCQAYNGPFAEETRKDREDFAMQIERTRKAAEEKQRREESLAQLLAEQRKQEEARHQAEDEARRRAEAAAKRPPEMIALRDTFDQSSQALEEAQNQALGETRDNYEKYLASTEATLQMQGDLDGVRAVRRELQRFQIAQTVPEDVAGLHASVVSARQAYKNAATRAEIDKKQKLALLIARYIRALEGLHNKLTLDGQLDGARIVASEIAEMKDEHARVTGSIPKPPAPVTTSAPRSAPTPPAVPKITRRVNTIEFEDAESDYCTHIEEFKDSSVDITEVAFRRRSSDRIEVSCTVRGALRTAPGHPTLSLFLDLDSSSETGRRVRGAQNTGSDLYVQVARHPQGVWEGFVRTHDESGEASDVRCEDVKDLGNKLLFTLESDRFKSLDSWVFVLISGQRGRIVDRVPNEDCTKASFVQ